MMRAATALAFDSTVDARDVPLYPATEAARFLRLPPATLSSWFKGRYYPAGGTQQWWEPLIEVADPDGLLLSFNNLVEAHVLKALRRKHGVPMHGVRIALDYARKQHHIERLFLSDELRTVEHDESDEEECTAGALFLEKLGAVEQISAGGQLVIRHALTRHLARVERDEEGLPVRLFPFIANYPDKSVLIDPRISFGRPVLAKRGIRVSTLVDRIEAGENPGHIAKDYGLTKSDILRALEFHEQAA